MTIGPTVNVVFLRKQRAQLRSTERSTECLRLVRIPGSGDVSSHRAGAASGKRFKCYLAVAYIRGTNRSPYIPHPEMAESVPTAQNLGKGAVPPKGEEGRRNERWRLPSLSIGIRVHRDRDPLS